MRIITYGIRIRERFSNTLQKVLFETRVRGFPSAVKEEKVVPCATADLLPSNYPLYML